MEKLLALDLDNTLAKINKPIKKTTLKLLEELSEIYTILVVSGKPTIYLSGLFRQIKNTKNIIISGENGSEIYYDTNMPPHDSYVNPFSKEELSEINYVKEKVKSLKSKYFYQNNLFSVTPFFKTNDKVAKEELYKLADELRLELEYVIPYKHIDCVDFTPKSVNKAKAVKQVMKKLKITKNNLVTIGDSSNDLSMFELSKKNSGLAYYIGNKDIYKKDVNKSFKSIDKALKTLLTKTKLVKEEYSTEIYIPVLLKFNNDKVIIPGKLLDNVNEEFQKVEDLNLEYDPDAKDGFKYKVLTHSFQEKYLEDSDLKGFSMKLKMYYYHHRFIFRYNLKYDDLKVFRQLRNGVKKHYKDLLDKFIPVINKVVNTYTGEEKSFNKDDAIVTMYYSYPIIFRDFKQFDFKNLSKKLETLFFKIYLPNRRLFSFGDEAYCRISIGGYTMYTKHELNNNVKANLINAIYQICLYEKKTYDFEGHSYIDKSGKEVFESTRYLVPYGKQAKKEISNVDKFNTVNEDLLKNMWEYSVDSMAGRISDLHQQRVSRILYLISVLSAILAIGAIVISIIK